MSKKGNEVISVQLPLFLPHMVLNGLFTHYAEAVEAIFRADLIDAFWDAIRPDDPKLLALIAEVEWATWLG